MAQWSAKWISYAYDPRQDVGVFAFRRRLRLDSVPPKLDVRVSADQRYKLFVNGQLVEFGPQRGDALHWFYETIDLAPHLRAGDNWISALVWNFGWMAPMAQCTVRSGFLFEPLDADQKDLATPHGWEVGLLKNWGFDMMHAGKGGYYIDVGPGELIDFRGAPWGWRVGEEPPGSVQWREPHVVYQAEDRGSNSGGTPWNLIPRSIPSMRYLRREVSPIHRRDFRDASAAPSTVCFPLEISPDEPVLLDYEELLCGYPRLRVRGPAGAVLKLTYEESLWQGDADRSIWEGTSGKGNRNEVYGRHAKGYQDRIILDGESREIEPLWWRTYRYLLIESELPLSPRERGMGGEGNVVIESLDAYETGYPLAEESSFEADDPWVKPIWDVSVRTARRCAGETYFDCPYYEQLQYVGDTRIQALIGYYLGRDRALQRNAIETLGWSLMENGLTQSRYPSRQPQVIPPFSLWWVMMLYDQWLYDDFDQYKPERFIAAEVDVSSAFTRRLFARAGDTVHPGFWPFADWVPQWPGGVPPKGVQSDVHRLTHYLAMFSTGHRFNYSGQNPVRAKADAAKQAADLLAHDFALRDGLHISKKEPEGPSEHVEALARYIQVLAGITPDAWPTEALAKANAAKCTYYFSYYKHLAMFSRPEHTANADKADRSYKPYPHDYIKQLEPWKEMIESGLTTFAENPEPVRSDCHAWSAHPILGFFQIVAGATSIAPAWKKARIMPHPGSLKRFDARIAHPDGELRVKFEDERLEIDTPVPATLEWRGQKQELKPGRHRF